MSKFSAAVTGHYPTDPFLQEIGGGPGASAATAEDAEIVHYLRVPPPAGGGTCTCDVCGMVFQSNSTKSSWITDRLKHSRNAYHGNFKSCQRQP